LSVFVFHNPLLDPKETTMKFVRISVISLAVLAGALALSGHRPAVGQARAPGPAPAGPNFVQPVPAIPGPVATSDPELAKILEDESSLDGQVHDLVGEYAATQDEGKRAAIKAKLAPLLDKQFDLQQKRRELEVARLEAQIKKVRDLMKKRAEGQKSIVEKRLDQILRDADGLGWTPARGAGHTGRAG
jgi:hypothetical protein